ncbi:DUF4190 domain-containing protein [Nocardia thailandica]|uniref:DUF4190 domain-containing protein n=1 Tax=Nocardia thailandica TaxID=257275 RepID=A0ABW6PQQ4_9NOCA|nr:hypothetical protein [Nocardia thailandica]
MSYPAPPYGYRPPPPDHPKASTVLILGILGLAVCQVVAPFAWIMGRRTLAEIDASGGTLGGRSNAQIGYILGIVGSVFLIFGLLVTLGAVLIFVLSVSAGNSGY